MRWFLVRAASALLTLAGALTLVFLALRLAPGDPADNVLGADAPESAKREFRARLQLDAPLPVQYAGLWRDVFNGTLGRCMRIGGTERTVAAAIAEVLPATAELALAAMGLALLLALPLGLLAAVRQGGLADAAVLGGAMLVAAVPVFWLGPMLLYAFTVHWSFLPGPGEPLRGALPLVLPAGALALGLAARLSRIVRAAILDVLREDYVTAARARGLSEARVLGRTVLRNALIPIVTVAGLQLAALLTGAIVTEKVFARPGIGTLLLDGIARRDYALVQGCVLVVTVVYVGTNLLLDALYVVLDPRLRRRAA